MAGQKGMKKPPKLLMDYRHVMEKPMEEDDTQQRKRLRELWDEDKWKFTDRLNRLEAAYQSRASGGDGAESVVAESADMGHEMVMALLEQKLAEWGARVPE